MESLNSHFSKDIQMAKKHMKICPTSIIIREIQIKTIKWCQFILPIIAIIKKSTNNECWKGCGAKRMHLHFWWEFKLAWPLWRTIWRFLKKLKIKLRRDPTGPFLGTYPDIAIFEKIYALSVHWSTICNSQDIEATYMSTYRAMDKEDVVHIYNGILLSHKNEIMWLALT